MIITFIVIFLIMGYVLFVLPTRWLKIEKVYYPLGLNCRILQVSDVHIERLRTHPDQLRQAIQREAPDLIVLTGDFTEREQCLPHLDRYLRILRESGRPVYAVLGNHDHILPDVERLVARLKYHRIDVLRNEAVKAKGFYLIGIDDYNTGHSDVDKAFSNVHDSSWPKIVITHDPNVILKIKQPFDYLMAGHFHGKQFNVPFLFWVKPMGPLPKMGIYQGLHQTEHGTLYISKGIGQTGLNMRLFVRSEITIHDL